MFKSFWLYYFFGILFFGELVLMAASEEVNLNDSKVCVWGVGFFSRKIYLFCSFCDFFVSSFCGDSVLFFC